MVTSHVTVADEALSESSSSLTLCGARGGAREGRGGGREEIR